MQGRSKNGVGEPMVNWRKMKKRAGNPQLVRRTPSPPPPGSPHQPLDLVEPSPDLRGAGQPVGRGPQGAQRRGTAVFSVDPLEYCVVFELIATPTADNV